MTILSVRRVPDSSARKIHLVVGSVILHYGIDILSAALFRSVVDFQLKRVGAALYLYVSRFQCFAYVDYAVQTLI